jgi:hypothetical protein
LGHLAAPVLVLVLVLAPHVLVLVLVLEKKVLATALQQVLTERDYSSAILQEFWNFQGPEGDNLPLVEVHVEAVHGILIRYDFRDLLDASCTTETFDPVGNHNCNFGHDQYGLYTNWRSAAREHSSSEQRTPVDWESLRGEQRENDD